MKELSKILDATYNDLTLGIPNRCVLFLCCFLFSSFYLDFFLNFFIMKIGCYSLKRQHNDKEHYLIILLKAEDPVQNAGYKNKMLLNTSVSVCQGQNEHHHPHVSIFSIFLPIFIYRFSLLFFTYTYKYTDLK